MKSIGPVDVLVLGAILVGSVLLTGCIEDNPQKSRSADAAVSAEDAAVEIDGQQSAADGGATDMASASDVLTLDMMAVMDAEPSGPNCDGVCSRLTECRAEICPMGDGPALAAACAAACGENPAFAAVASGLVACQDLMAFARQQSDDIDALCVDAPVEEGGCAFYGVRAAECLVEVCPNARSFDVGVAPYMQGICENLVAQGNFSLEQLRGIEQAGCNDPRIGPVLGFLTTRGEHPASGGLESLCTDGPLVPDETCETACNRLGICIPEGTSDDDGGQLRDYGTCRTTCASFPNISPLVWGCIADTVEMGPPPGGQELLAACRDAFRCFSNPPTIEVCVPYGARTTECLLETCANAAPHREAVTKMLTDTCTQLVGNQFFDEEAVGTVGPESPCDHELIGGMVQNFTMENAVDPNAGFLMGLCTDGPANEDAICDQACTHLGPCLELVEDDDADALRDHGMCSFLCAAGVDELPPERWACFAEDPACPQVFACGPDDE